MKAIIVVRLRLSLLQDCNPIGEVDEKDSSLHCSNPGFSGWKLCMTWAMLLPRKEQFPETRKPVLRQEV